MFHYAQFNYKYSHKKHEWNQIIVFFCRVVDTRSHKKTHISLPGFEPAKRKLKHVSAPPLPLDQTVIWECETFLLIRIIHCKVYRYGPSQRKIPHIRISALQHESFRADRDSNQRGEGLRDHLRTVGKLECLQTWMFLRRPGLEPMRRGAERFRVKRLNQTANVWIRG